MSAAKPVDKLAAMANQIATFFRSYPDDKAIAGIASHIEAFWTPRMRETLRVHAPTHVGLDPLVVRAVSTRVEAMSPAAREIAGPERLGALGAVDAG